MPEHIDGDCKCWGCVSKWAIGHQGTNLNYSGFVEDSIGIELDPWQSDLLDRLMPTRATHSTTISFEISNPSAPEVLDLFYGRRRPAAPRYSISWDYFVSGEPSPPVKGSRLMGKRYRQARRQYSRNLRAWHRAGRPGSRHSMYIPEATVRQGLTASEFIFDERSPEQFVGRIDGY